MSRAIVSYSNVAQAMPGMVREGAPPPPPLPEDKYRDRLLKYIPAEVVTFYLGLSATAAAATNVPGTVHWAIFAVGIVATPFYLRYYLDVRVRVQLVISTLAFVVWVFALGRPFTDFAWYQQIYGALLLPIFTFFVAGIKPEPADGK